MAAAVETFDLSKDYRIGFWRPKPYRALDRVTFSVDQGEVFGFLGPNGAGKTTTLKLLMQLVFPTGGHAHILGKPLGDVGVKQRIGFLPENPYFYDYLTAEELLTYFAGLFGYSGADRRQRVARLLDDVGLGHERRLQLRKFSKGMIQRVGLAQALINDPEVVFLDEPMSGLDPLGRRDVRQLILRLRNEGRTVFFSSHILSDAETLCSRIAIVAKGRLMAAGRLSEILTVRMLGWEVIIEDLDAAPDAALVGRALKGVTQIDARRYAIELAPDVQPEQMLDRLLGARGRLVSINPVRETLEDFFVRQVHDAGTRSRFVGDAGAPASAESGPKAESKPEPEPVALEKSR
jgi:ABC-2 type transport system ATP-binding protein